MFVVCASALLGLKIEREEENGILMLSKYPQNTAAYIVFMCDHRFDILFTRVCSYSYLLLHTIRDVLLMSAHMNAPSVPCMPCARLQHVVYRSVRLVCYGLQRWSEKGGNPQSVQSCYLLSQHDPAWPRGAYRCAAKIMGPNKPAAAPPRPTISLQQKQLLPYLTCFPLISNLKFKWFKAPLHSKMWSRVLCDLCSVECVALC